MSFRKVLFWLHLVAGLVAGLSIGIMCFTGVVLAYEKQIVSWSERDARRVDAPTADQARLSLDELTSRVRTAHPDASPASIIVSADPRDAVTFSLGRDNTVFANPYTGAIQKPASTAVHDFMHVMEDWHRVLAFAGDNRPVGKAINGACNLAFFALAVTGLYLWMPRRWSWRSVRAVALFNSRLTGKARDFNWHNTIGLWSAPILIVLTLTAVPISYRWGGNLIYTLVGETPPPPGPPGGASTAVELPPPPAGARPLSRDAQFAAIQNEFPAWQQITLRLAAPGRGRPPAAGAANSPATPTTTLASSSPSAAPDRAARRERASGPQPLNFIIKLPDAWPRTATTTAVMNPFTGDLLRRETFGDLTTGRQVRTWTRFLHTGEALGWFGQLIAGLASLGGCFLVYTGFALSWRRFFGKKNPVEAAALPTHVAESQVK
jgi:uncharacterized iron-regulated membrane protein